MPQSYAHYEVPQAVLLLTQYDILCSIYMYIYVCSLSQLVMVEERRWPLGNKITELHGGFGLISTIKWKENLIAWANEKVYIP